MLIALSLTFAPITSAWAALQMDANMHASEAIALADETVSDCMKAMHGTGHSEGKAQHQNCPCCDTPSKSTCSDACLAKCSVHVMAVLAAVVETRLPTIGHVRPVEQEKPPDWSSAPPAPPPRA